MFQGNWLSARFYKMPVCSKRLMQSAHLLMLLLPNLPYDKLFLCSFVLVVSNLHCCAAGFTAFLKTFHHSPFISFTEIAGNSIILCHMMSKYTSLCSHCFWVGCSIFTCFKPLSSWLSFWSTVSYVILLELGKVWSFRNVFSCTKTRNIVILNLLSWNGLSCFGTKSPFYLSSFQGAVYQLCVPPTLWCNFCTYC